MAEERPLHVRPSDAPAGKRADGSIPRPADFDDDFAKVVLRRFRKGFLAACICGWTGLWAALYVAILAALIGAFVGGLTGPVGFLKGFVAGLAVGFGFFFLTLAAGTLSAPIWGGAVGLLAAAVADWSEQWLLTWRGWRRPSRRETERLEPLLAEVAQALGVVDVPLLAVRDQPVPFAGAFARTIGVTTELLKMPDDQLSAVLAHELFHWKQSVARALRVVWGAALPCALVYDLGAWLSGGFGQDDKPVRPPSQLPQPRKTSPVVGALLGWILAWPAWVLIKFVISPLLASDVRRSEYDADCAAARAGYGEPLMRALEEIGEFDPRRPGWEGTVCALHPPVELRLEHLEEHLHEPPPPPPPAQRVPESTPSRAPTTEHQGLIIPTHKP